MKKYLAEGIVIFASIFASFSVENFRQNSIEKEELNDAVITLGDEIISNIDFTKEHLKQVKNMLYLTEQVVNEFNTITLKEALCGFIFIITHINGKEFTIKNKKIIEPGSKTTIKNLGFKRDNNIGNLIINFNISFPKNISPEAIEQLNSIL